MCGRRYCFRVDSGEARRDVGRHVFRSASRRFTKLEIYKSSSSDIGRNIRLKYRASQGEHNINLPSPNCQIR
ncbi:hypothetical protein QVD17_05965 [Tagetes erecta]|uniref:Uncharacterized protein n=1 Tax=Tagetes erecta TaxID=13708 RepID=A0AAD8LMJ9_TARER|nr:hypothetical protein QVD17_05965 [Tagetes erecta]